MQVVGGWVSPSHDDYVQPKARRARTRYFPTPVRARSHCCFVLSLIHFIPDSLTESVPLFLKRQCDRTLTQVRAAAVALATAESDWLDVGRWEGWRPGGWPDFPEVAASLRAALVAAFGESRAPTVFYVCGHDLYMRAGQCGGMTSPGRCCHLD
jgi:hypothetical protein